MNSHCVARQLGRAEPTTIALLGTSITWGRGSRTAACTEPGVDGCAMPSQVRKLLRKRFPNTELNIAIHAYPGASPMYLAACIEREGLRTTTLIADHVDEGHETVRIPPRHRNGEPAAGKSPRDCTARRVARPNNQSDAVRAVAYHC